MTAWLTTTDVANRLGFTRKTVAEWCSRGKVTGAEKFPDDSPRSEWRVPSGWVEQRLRERAASQPIPRDRLDQLMDAALAKTA